MKFELVQDGKKVKSSIVTKILKEIEHCGFDQDIIDVIIRVELFETKEMLLSEIKELEKRENLESYEEEDLEYSRKIVRSLTEVIKYYSIPDVE